MKLRRRLHAHQSRTFSERKRERGIFLLGLVIVAIGTWAYSLSRLTYLPFLAVNSVQIVGADPEIIGSLQAAAEGALQGDYLGLFSKANAFTYSEKTVEAKVKDASARIESVSVKKSGLNGIAVSVREKTPSAIVCASLPDLAAPTSDSCYFADSTGYIFEPAPSVTGNAYDHFYIPALSDSAAAVVGSYATSTQAFESLVSFLKSVRDGGLYADGLLVKDNGEYEMYTRNPGAATADDTVVVYFNDSRPITEELSNLLTFWNNEIETAKVKHDTVKFDYIDVRYGSNVFYRMMK